MKKDYRCVTTVRGIRDYIGDSRTVAFDFETAPDEAYLDEEKAALDPARAHICGCSFSVKEGTAIYVPVAHRTGENIDEDAFFPFFKEFLTDTGITKVAHNIAFESSMAYKRGIVIQAPVYDTICASQLTLKGAYEFRTLSDSGLKRLAGEICGEELPPWLMAWPQVPLIVLAAFLNGNSAAAMAIFSARFVEISPILSMCIASSNRYTCAVCPSSVLV